MYKNAVKAMRGPVPCCGKNAEGTADGQEGRVMHERHTLGRRQKKSQ